jgi:hypothetical protein
LDRARPLFEHFIEITAQHTGIDSTGKSEALRKIVPLLRKVKDPVDVSILRQHVARRLDVDENVVAGAISSRDKTPSKDLVPTGQRGRQGDYEIRNADRSAELMLVEAMLRYPYVIDGVFESIGPAHFCDEWCRTVVGLISDAQEGMDEMNIREMIEDIGDEELAKQLRAIAVESEGEDEEEDEQNVKALVTDCVDKILSRPARARIEAINDDIRRAENEGDDERIMALLAEKKQLISKVYARDGQ